MPSTDDLIPTAGEVRKQAALKEAEKAEEAARRQGAAEASRLSDRLSNHRVSWRDAG